MKLRHAATREAKHYCKNGIGVARVIAPDVNR
jgi:hypothetical protein